MTEKQAWNKFLSSGKQSARNTINVLMKWDEKFTVNDNAIFLRISRDSAYHFAVKYGLEYRKIGVGNNYKGRFK